MCTSEASKEFTHNLVKTPRGIVNRGECKGWLKIKSACTDFLTHQTQKTKCIKHKDAKSEIIKHEKQNATEVLPGIYNTKFNNELSGNV